MKCTGTYTRYEPVTPKEALLALAEEATGKDWKYIKVKAWGGSAEKCGRLQHVEPYNTLPFYVNGSYHRHCARIVHVNPREVPEGCAPLPEDKPWLAYVPKDMIPEYLQRPWDWLYLYLPRRNDWHSNVFGLSHNTDKECYAINVDHPEAKQHFPEIVACYEEDSTKDGFDKHWKIVQGAADVAEMSVKDHHRSAWNAALAWKESQK